MLRAKSKALASARAGHSHVETHGCIGLGEFWAWLLQGGSNPVNIFWFWKRLKGNVWVRLKSNLTIYNRMLIKMFYVYRLLKV